MHYCFHIAKPRNFRFMARQARSLREFAGRLGSGNLPFSELSPKTRHRKPRKMLPPKSPPLNWPGTLGAGGGSEYRIVPNLNQM